MSFSVTFKSHITTRERLTGDDLAAPSTLIHDGYDVTKALDGTTTPDAAAVAYQTVLMTAGAASVDLTSLLLNGNAVNLNAKEPRFLRVLALTTNANALTVVKGASNGYDGMGSAFSVTLEPGQSFTFDFAATGNAVGGSNKTLDLSGTGTQGVQLSIVAGAT